MTTQEGVQESNPIRTPRPAAAPCCSCSLSELRKWKTPTKSGAAVAVATLLYLALIYNPYSYAYLIVRFIQLAALAGFIARKFAPAQAKMLNIMDKKQLLVDHFNQCIQRSLDCGMHAFAKITGEESSCVLCIIAYAQGAWLLVRILGLITLAYFAFMGYMLWPLIYAKHGKQIDELQKTVTTQVNGVIYKISDACPPAIKDTLKKAGINLPCKAAPAKRN